MIKKCQLLFMKLPSIFEFTEMLCSFFVALLLSFVFYLDLMNSCVLSTVSLWHFRYRINWLRISCNSGRDFDYVLQ